VTLVRITQHLAEALGQCDQDRVGLAVASVVQNDYRDFAELAGSAKVCRSRFTRNIEINAAVLMLNLGEQEEQANLV